MVHTFDGFNYVLRLDHNEQLAATLQKFMQATKLEGAWLSGLGAAHQMILGYYELNNKQYSWKTFNGLFEVVSLQGNLAYNQAGEPVFHLHGVFSDQNYQTMAGHVKDLTVGATLELFIHRTYKPLHRQLDDAVGLETLNFS